MPGASQLELFAAALVLLKVGRAESGKRKALVGNTSLCHLATLHVHAESFRSRYPKGKIV